MTSQDNALDEALKELGLARFEPPPPKPGGLVHVFQILEERSRARLGDLCEEYAVPGGVSFGFAEDRGFSAFADRRANDVICIYSATVRTLWSFCNAVMAVRESFPWIDDIDRLGENAPPPPKGELFFIQQGSGGSGQFEPVRRRLAAALFDAAMDFALMHEVGHLWNGHVELLHREVGPQPLQETPVAGARGFDWAEARALEFDADSFAAQKVFARAYHENQFKEFSDALLKDHRVPLDGEHTASWYFTWFAIYAFFRLFDEACAVAEIEQRPQPYAPLRQACLLSTVAAVCSRQGWSKLTMPSWEILATDAAVEAERAICRLRRMPIDANALLAVWEGPAVNQIEAYLQSWDGLAPRLQPLRRGAQAAKSSAAPAEGR